MVERGCILFVELLVGIFFRRVLEYKVFLFRWMQFCILVLGGVVEQFVGWVLVCLCVQQFGCFFFLGLVLVVYFLIRFFFQSGYMYLEIFGVLRSVVFFFEVILVLVQRYRGLGRYRVCVVDSWFSGRGGREFVSGFIVFSVFWEVVFLVEKYFGFIFGFRKNLKFGFDYMISYF